MRKEIELLEDHPDLFAQTAKRGAVRAATLLLFAHRRERSVDSYGAALDRFERRQASEQSALAGTARPDHDEDLARHHFEIDAIENCADPVTLHQSFDRNKSFGH